jgi:hypothetical protein
MLKPTQTNFNPNQDKVGRSVAVSRRRRGSTSSTIYNARCWNGEFDAEPLEIKHERRLKFKRDMHYNHFKQHTIRMPRRRKLAKGKFDPEFFNSDGELIHFQTLHTDDDARYVIFLYGNPLITRTVCIPQDIRQPVLDLENEQFWMLIKKLDWEHDDLDDGLNLLCFRIMRFNRIPMWWKQWTVEWAERCIVWYGSEVDSLSVSTDNSRVPMMEVEDLMDMYGYDLRDWRAFDAIMAVRYSTRGDRLVMFDGPHVNYWNAFYIMTDWENNRMIPECRGYHRFKRSLSEQDLPYSMDNLGYYYSRGMYKNYKHELKVCNPNVEPEERHAWFNQILTLHDVGSIDGQKQLAHVRVHDQMLRCNTQPISSATEPFVEDVVKSVPAFPDIIPGGFRKQIYPIPEEDEDDLEEELPKVKHVHFHDIDVERDFYEHHNLEQFHRDMRGPILGDPLGDPMGVPRQTFAEPRKGVTDDIFDVLCDGVDSYKHSDLFDEAGTMVAHAVSLYDALTPVWNAIIGQGSMLNAVVRFTSYLVAVWKVKISSIVGTIAEVLKILGAYLIEYICEVGGLVAAGVYNGIQYCKHEGKIIFGYPTCAANTMPESDAPVRDQNHPAITRLLNWIFGGENSVFIIDSPIWTKLKGLCSIGPMTALLALTGIDIEKNILFSWLNKAEAIDSASRLLDVTIEMITRVIPAMKAKDVGLLFGNQDPGYEWIQRVDKLCNSGRTPGEIITTFPSLPNEEVHMKHIRLMRHLEESTMEGELLVKRFQKFSPHTCFAINNRLQQLDMVYKTAKVTQNMFVWRQPPVCIILWGNPGGGKTSMAQKLANAIGERLGFKGNMYCKDMSTKFWDAMLDQQVLFLDDLGQIDPAKIPPEAIETIIGIPGMSPKMLNQADLADKGKMFANFKLVIATSNSERIAQGLFVSQAALERRFPICVEVILEDDGSQTLKVQIKRPRGATNHVVFAQTFNGNTAEADFYTWLLPFCVEEDQRNREYLAKMTTIVRCEHGVLDYTCRTCSLARVNRRLPTFFWYPTLVNDLAQKHFPTASGNSIYSLLVTVPVVEEACKSLALYSLPFGSVCVLLFALIVAEHVIYPVQDFWFLADSVHLMSLFLPFAYSVIYHMFVSYFLLYMMFTIEPDISGIAIQKVADNSGAVALYSFICSRLNCLMVYLGTRFGIFVEGSGLTVHGFDTFTERVVIKHMQNIGKYYRRKVTDDVWKNIVPITIISGLLVGYKLWRMSSKMNIQDQVAFDPIPSDVQMAHDKLNLRLSVPPSVPDFGKPKGDVWKRATFVGFNTPIIAPNIVPSVMNNIHAQVVQIKVNNNRATGVQILGNIWCNNHSIPKDGVFLFEVRQRDGRIFDFHIEQKNVLRVGLPSDNCVIRIGSPLRYTKDLTRWIHTNGTIAGKPKIYMLTFADKFELDVDWSPVPIQGGMISPFSYKPTQTQLDAGVCKDGCSGSAIVFELANQVGILGIHRGITPNLAGVFQLADLKIITLLSSFDDTQPLPVAEQPVSDQMCSRRRIPIEAFKENSILKHVVNLGTRNLPIALLGTDVSHKGGINKASVRESILHPYFSHHIPNITRPIFAPRIDAITGEWLNPYLVKLSSVLTTPQITSLPLLRRAQTQVIENMWNLRRCDVPKPYSLDQAIIGDQSAGLQPMNLNSSCGYPYRGPKRERVFGDPGRDLKLPLEVYDDIEFMLDQLELGIAPMQLFTWSLKDEPIKKSKNDEARVRVFSGSQLAALVVLRMYIGPYLAWCQQHRDVFDCKVGINATSDEWDSFAKWMKAIGKHKVKNGDFKDYDNKLWETFVGPEICWEHCRRSGWLDRDIKILWALIPMYIRHGVHACGDVFVTEEQASGGLGTSVFNSLPESTREIMIYEAAYMFHGLPNEELAMPVSDWYLRVPPTELLFYKHSRLGNFGDDNINTVSETALRFYNDVNIARACGALGFLLTDSVDKTKPPKLRDSIEECDFLKRGFTISEDSGKYIAPLAESSIYKSLSWILPGALTNEQHAKVVLEDAQKHFFLHGKKRFVDFQEELKQVPQHLFTYLKYEDILKTYNECSETHTPFTKFE